MMFTLSKSTRKDKKFMISYVLDGRTKTVHFGAAGMSDYTKHKDPSRKDDYIRRHSSREDWSDPTTAGFWSRWLLWNLPSLRDSLADIKKRFKLDVVSA